MNCEIGNYREVNFAQLATSVVRELRGLMLQQSAYIESLPPHVREFVFDNDYNALQDRQNALLSEVFFGDMYEDVAWFLYEYKIGSAGPHVTLQDGREITFQTDEDYYSYLEAEYGARD